MHACVKPGIKNRTEIMSSMKFRYHIYFYSLLDTYKLHCPRHKVKIASNVAAIIKWVPIPQYENKYLDLARRVSSVKSYQRNFKHLYVMEVDIKKASLGVAPFN